MVYAKLEAVDRQNIGRAVLDNVYGCGTASKRQRIVANSVDCGSARSLLDELHRAADSAIDGHVAGGHGDGINAGVAIDGAVLCYRHRGIGSRQGDDLGRSRWR